MKPKSTSQPPAAPSILALAVRRALLGGLWLGCGSSMALAAGHPGLPESINQGQEVGLKIPDLTRPALHRGIDVGHASGTFGANGRSLTVDQTTAKAILDWNRFDIAAGNAVRFNQPSASAVVLNQIHQSDPSRIFGALTANGQVYLINHNGFLFGKGAQVDTNTLVVSTLAIKDENFAKGITKVVDSGAGGSREPVAALTGDGSVYRTAADGSREKIGIRIEQGASLHGDGGRVLLAAPAIENRGEVSANGGQVILAAATDKVYLQEADPKSDLRGLLVEVKTGGSIDNLGKVIAGHGNSTLVGFAIHQQGLVSASTTVALGGSVRLLARENATLKADGNGAYVLTPGSTRRSAETGDGLGERAAVTLGQGSRTTVKLDGSGGSAVDGQDQPHSQIDIEAGRIVLKSGSTVRAKGGDVSLIASESPGVPLGETSASNGSRILIERDATVDVSGSRQSTVAMERNVVDVELRDNELRDAPLQKDGVLHGKTIAVDLRKGTPLADITGATARIRRSVQERNSAGGTIGLSSEGDVVVQGGSTLNVAGGQVRYRDGYVKTSRLLSGGQVIDVAAANPDR
ncbi:MAG: filamentous hemagglutinin N-terminal domain-containing protein, partial [Methylococcaceae bacterium]|nr:filamentous hemagglutinin N-terminal domain-containing protein [Methylococcaceae bacterium]